VELVKGMTVSSKEIGENAKKAAKKKYGNNLKIFPEKKLGKKVLMVN
jgi:hypothetical protein